MSDDTIKAGIAALASINKTGIRTLESWLLVGKALKVGRDLHKSHNAFGDWLRYHMPTLAGQSMASTRKAALWLITPEGADVLQSGQIGLSMSHPVVIYKAFKKNEAKAGQERIPKAAEATTSPERAAWVRAAFTAMDSDDAEMVDSFASWDYERLMKLRAVISAAIDRLDEAEAPAPAKAPQRARIVKARVLERVPELEAA